MGRKKLPVGEKKSKVEVFVKEKMIEKIGRKECENIAVAAVVDEYLKFEKQT